MDTFLELLEQQRKVVQQRFNELENKETNLATQLKTEDNVVKDIIKLYKSLTAK